MAKTPVYSGRFNYTTDTGKVIIANFRIESTVETGADPAIAATFTAAIVAALPANPCAGAANLKTRRLIIVLRKGTAEAPIYVERQIPVATRALLPTIATALANNAAVVCMRYQGEQYRNVHRATPPAGGGT